ncbi:hypothetical protein [Stenotrophomonas sp.]|uniref:hypothetical protein n=1 Tax=Stenotrophomonas sp. TaxID=69392 RepID=UPI0028AFEDF1|nr:hypothetical protein [Stenotrophomonas sp.]
MADWLSGVEKERLVKEVSDCVRAGGDVEGVIRVWCDGLAPRDRQVREGARYTAKVVAEQVEREEAEKAARDAFLSDDIAVVEDLIQRLPKVLERLRAAEAANGR